MSTEETSNGSALLMFTLGAASGAIVALLCAPATGRRSRDYLRERALEVGDQAAAAAAKAQALVRQSAQAVVSSIDDWSASVTNALEDGRQVVEQAKSTVTDAVEQGRSAYERAKSQA